MTLKLAIRRKPQLTAHKNPKICNYCKDEGAGMQCFCKRANYCGADCYVNHIHIHEVECSEHRRNALEENSFFDCKLSNTYDMLEIATIALKSGSFVVCDSLVTTGRLAVSDMIWEKDEEKDCIRVLKDIEISFLLIMVECSFFAGNYKECLDGIDRATRMLYDQREEDGSDINGDIANLLVFKGRVAFCKGNFIDSFNNYTCALERFERPLVLGFSYRIVVTMMIYTVVMYLDISEDPRAASLLKVVEMHMLKMDEEDDELSGRFYHAQGIFYLRNKEFRNITLARAHLEASLRSFRKLANASGKHPLITGALFGLGEYYYMASEYIDGLRMYDKGILHLRRNLGDNPDNIEIAHAMVGIADIQFKQGIPLPLGIALHCLGFRVYFYYFT
jgi:tetratricopeptide (TPR) repeat protein